MKFLADSWSYSSWVSVITVRIQGTYLKKCLCMLLLSISILDLNILITISSGLTIFSSGCTSHENMHAHTLLCIRQLFIKHNKLQCSMSQLYSVLTLSNIITNYDAACSHWIDNTQGKILNYCLSNFTWMHHFF